MQKKKMTITILLLCALILLTSIAVVLAFQSLNHNTYVNKRPPIELDFNVYAIGDSEALTAFINLANNYGAKTAVLDIQNFESDPRSLVFNQSSIIVFDGNWLQQNYDNRQLLVFLAANTKDVGGVVAIGESVTNLYIALNKAGIYELSRDESGNIRFPIPETATIAGFALNEVADPYGKLCVPSIFTTCSTDGYDVMQDISNWLDLNSVYDVLKVKKF